MREGENLDGACLSSGRRANQTVQSSPHARVRLSLFVTVLLTIATTAKASVPDADFASLDVGTIQFAWLLLILAAPLLCWRVGRFVGVGGGRAAIAVALSITAALAAVSRTGDEPLHANGHAWREAREVLLPVGASSRGVAPFLHGKGGIALQWLLAEGEGLVTGTANPFRISRIASAAAAGATALLVIVLVRSVWAGLAAGFVLAFTPLEQMLAASGSVLAVAGWLLPWSLALLITAGISGDAILLAGAALAAALGTLSHTAMLGWPFALLAAWLLIAQRQHRWGRAAVGAFAIVMVAWVFQLSTVYDLIAERNQGPGLLVAAQHGFLDRNLFLSRSWVSPTLIPLALLWVVSSLARRRLILMAAAVSALTLVAAPFFAVTACSSDAARYQGALLGLVTSFAVAGIWWNPWPRRVARACTALFRPVLLATLVILPLPSERPATDPVVLEHRLVEEAVRRMPPGTLVILPRDRLARGTIVPEFPDFLLPKDSLVVPSGDPIIETYTGPRLVYLGLACISWNEDESPSSNTTDGSESPGMRPECRKLHQGTKPWLVRSLEAQDLPRWQGQEDAWTFHRLALGTPFGFFALPETGNGSSTDTAPALPYAFLAPS